MCLRTTKQWSRLSSRAEVQQWDTYPEPTELRLIGYLTEPTWTRKSKSNMLTPKTNSETYWQGAISHVSSPSVQYWHVQVSKLLRNDVEKDATRKRRSENCGEVEADVELGLYFGKLSYSALIECIKSPGDTQNTQSARFESHDRMCRETCRWRFKSKRRSVKFSSVANKCKGERTCEEARRSRNEPGSEFWRTFKEICRRKYDEDAKWPHNNRISLWTCHTSRKSTRTCAPDNLGNPFSCGPEHCSYGTARCIACKKSAQEHTTAHLGWNYDHVNVHVDALREHLKCEFCHQNQSCGQRGCVSALASGHGRPVALAKSSIFISNSACEMSLMECGLPGNLTLKWSRIIFQEVSTVAMKFENTIQLAIGLGFNSSADEDVDHDALWLALLDEVRQPEAHAPNCSVTDCDMIIEKKLSSIGSTLHVHVKEEEWENFFQQSVSDGKEERKRNRDHFSHTFFWRSKCVKGMCEAESDCTHSSLYQRRQSWVSSRSGPDIGGWTTGGLELLFSAIHDASYGSLFLYHDGAHRIETVVGLTCEETNWNVADRGSHVFRILTRSDGTDTDVCVRISFIKF